MDKRKSLIASVFLALVALSWGSSYSIVKDSLSMLEPFTLMAFRFTTSGLLLSLIYAKKLLKITRKEVKQGTIIGIFLFSAFAALAIGVSHTSASKASFLIGSYVLTVPFFAWFINKKRPDRFDIIGAVCATTGLGLLTLGSITGLNKGDIICVICSLAFAFHMIMIEKFCHDADSIRLTIVQFWFAAVCFVFLSLFTENHDLTPIVSIKYSLAYLIIASTVIAFVVQNVAQKYISSTATALILTLESVFGSIFALFYLNETMTLTMATGCATVFVGILIQQIKPGKKKKEEKT